MNVVVGQAAARALNEAILREGRDTVAAFIAEPVMGVGGVIVPPQDYFPLIRRICDENDILFIADEVITGFGRTGDWFGLKHWNVKPDILSFAKAITSGYAQLGGIQISDEIRETMESAADTEAYMHGFTYSGHAMACAVGLKNIELMEKEDFPARARELGARLKNGLSTLLEFPFVGEVRGLGLVCGVEIVSDKENKTADPSLAMKIFKAAQDRGLRSRPLGNVLAFSPPLSINEEEVDEIIKRTLIVLIIVIISKETLFRFVIKVGTTVNSIAVKSDAWHHRSDAITSAAAFIGISAALIGGEGYESADDFAALFASVIIIFNAYRIFKPALFELLDKRHRQKQVKKSGM